MERLQLDASEEPGIDVNVPIRRMVHWRPPTIEIDPAQRLEHRHEATVSRSSLGTHSATDAPVHFMIDGVDIDRVPFERLVGPAPPDRRI
jgi:kynurenine formamidase